MSRLSALRRLVVAASLVATVAAPALATPQAALAYAACSDMQLKLGARWLVPLWAGDCARFNGTMRPSSEKLGDGSRGERFEVPLIDATCLKATITSNDFTPDVYVYADSSFQNEVGDWQRRGNTASSTVRVANVDDVPVLYVLATSYGPGAQFGDYTLDLRTC
jgi:hypothetical protein